MKSIIAGSIIALLACHTAQAATATYIMNMTGDQEVGGGDPDGLGTGTITVDDSTGEVSWDFSYMDIDPPTAMHIHAAPAGSNGGVHIGLTVNTSGGAGTLIDSLVHMPTSDVTAILNDPEGFYVNIHNGDFPGGALRGQLGTVPEPSSSLLLILGSLWLCRIR